MVGLYFLFIYTAGMMLLGTIVLAFTPFLRLTVTNLLVFMVGGAAGMFALANLFIFGARLLVGLLRISVGQTADILIYFPAVIGAVLGGAALVWLKMRIRGGKDATP